MLKRLIFRSSLSLILLGSLINNASAQQYICEYAGRSSARHITVSAPSDIAVTRINHILNVIGLSGNFNILSANIDNAAALIHGSDRYILFNPHFMQAVHDVAGTGWTSYSILAHEIGHHLNGHTIGHKSSSHQIELEADEFSGFILGKLGATLTDAQKAMVLIASDKASHTHPARHTRLEAISKGWKRANNIS